MSTTQPQIDPQQVQIPATGANTSGVAPLGPSTPAGPPPAAGQPSVWKDLAMGALWGMVGASKSGALNGRMTGGNAFAAGAAGGAAGVLEEEPQFKAQMAQAAADVKFKSAQAADLQTQYAIHEAQLNHLPQEYQDELNNNNLDMMSKLQGLGITPVAVTGDNPGDATVTGRNLTKQYGGVGNLYTFEVKQGGKTVHVSYDLDQLAAKPQGLSIINEAETAQSGKELTTRQMWAQMTPVQKVAAQNEALHYLNPQITDREGLDSAKATLATLQAQPQTDTVKNLATKYQKAIDTADPVVAQMEQAANQRAAAKQATVTQAAIDTETSPENTAKEAASAGAKTDAEQKAREKYNLKSVYATDPNGNTVMLTQSQADSTPGLTNVRQVNETTVRQDEHDISVLNDITVKASNVQKTAGAMDTNSWVQVTEIARGLADHPNKTLSSIVNSKVMGALTPQAQAYVIAVNSLRETSMGLQKVLTGSARNNETQLQALLNTLPGVEPNSGIVNQKLDAFTQNLGILSKMYPSNLPTQNLAARGASAASSGYVRIRSSDGNLHDIPTQNLGAARKIDPNLQVIQ